MPKKRVAAREAALEEAKSSHEKLMEDIAKHREKLAELEHEVELGKPLATEVAAESMDEESASTQLQAAQAGIKQLQEQIDALKANHDEAMAAIKKHGTAEMANIRKEMQAEHEAEKTNIIQQGKSAVADVRKTVKALMKEKEDLRKAAACRPAAAEVISTDLPTLEQEILKKQAELGEARASEDVEDFERLTEEHAALSTALA